MDDRTIMENLLTNAKSSCDLYMHGTIESSTPNVHQAFNDALGEQLSMQECIYKQMSQKGWYPSDQAPAQQVQQMKQKFTPTC